VNKPQQDLTDFLLDEFLEESNPNVKRDILAELESNTNVNQSHIEYIVGVKAPSLAKVKFILNQMETNSTLNHSEVIPILLKLFTDNSSPIIKNLILDKLRFNTAVTLDDVLIILKVKSPVKNKLDFILDQLEYNDNLAPLDIVPILFNHILVGYEANRKALTPILMQYSTLFQPKQWNILIQNASDYNEGSKFFDMIPPNYIDTQLVTTLITREGACSKDIAARVMDECIRLKKLGKRKLEEELTVKFLITCFKHLNLCHIIDMFEQVLIPNNIQISATVRDYLKYKRFKGMEDELRQLSAYIV
jgi:hypothetical protein